MLVRELVPSGTHKTSRCLVFNPGQGYAAVAIAKLLAPRAVDLVDRDLLGLRQTRLNLDENGYRGRINLHHQAGLAGDRDAGLIAGVLREEEGPAAVLGTIDAAIGRLAPGGVLLTASTSTAATRIEKHLRSTGVARVHRRKRRHGVSVLQIRR
jgi:hypothetical protein